MYKLYNSCKNKKTFLAMQKPTSCTSKTHFLQCKNHTFEIQPPTYVNTK